ncbi:phospholipase D family protein [Paenibacillus eucommiae]|uniref:phospholipase D n=1 Tax=Paenibacillus eucommiae TaxID=1355755 RepID=A0ABS4ITG6_9BACL|nr:phospholipase D family protein [Paenibacillus eucommiae]MBP1990415.1 HKD family nuclease [Paenibacillus eucommiae]
MKNLTSQSLSKRAPKSRKKRFWLLIILLLFLFLLVLIGVMIYQTHKPLPAGLSMEAPVRLVKDTDVEFLYDLTYKKAGQTVYEQMIFERIIKAIEEAEQFIVVDMFLFNGYYKKEQSFPPLSRKLTDALIAQRNRHPQMPILIITDEVNTSYGSHPSEELELLEASGIPTSITDVDPLRDSSPLYSGIWRMFMQGFGQSGKGWIPNLMADTAPDMTLRSYMKLLNVKANHRKIIATEKTLIVPSANAHDASFYNSNTGFAVKGDIIGDALLSEQAALNLSESELTVPDFDFESMAQAGADGEANGEANVQLRFLTEGKILQRVLQSLAATESGDTVWMAMFYLADRQVIQELLQAAERGVQIRLILDPNENAFGNDKIGLPNRPVASELLEKSDKQIQIRWYNTGKEQFHSKLMFIEQKDQITIHNGSANFTTRNLADLNLESNLEIQASPDSRLAQQVRQYFQRLWGNDGAEFTLDYEAYEDKTVALKKAMYALQRWLGFTTY